MNLLIVCTGNICRSPTAHGILSHLIDARGWGDRISVDSAGTTAYHTGDPPSRPAQIIAAERGIDLSGLRARPVVADDFHRFDRLYGMDNGHIRWLGRQQPRDSAAEISLFRTAIAGGPREVPDPYYGTAEDYAQAFDLIMEGAIGLLDRLAGER